MTAMSLAREDSVAVRIYPLKPKTLKIFRYPLVAILLAREDLVTVRMYPF